MMKTINVKIISLEGCPATPPTIALVQQTAADLELPIDLLHLTIKTPQEAVAQRHIGSPTVQINGLDMEAEARDLQQFGLT